MYAKQVSKTTARQKEIAMFEAEMFGHEIGYMFTNLSRCYAGHYLVDFVNPLDDNEDTNWGTADIVRCPHCKQIQVCFGQYGDPEHENLVCTQCHKVFEMEPF